MFPVFRKKRTVHARSHICRNHSCLDRESTTSAEWIHKNAVFIPWRQHDQCRGQRLSDRSFDSHLTITSLMKRNSGCINPDRSHILHKGYSNREACTILLKPGNSINTFQAFYDCFFHDGLNIRRTEQRTLHRIGFCYPELAILRNIFFPRDRLCFFKKFVKCHCFKLSGLQQNPLCRTKEHIGLCNTFRICQKRNFAIFYLTDLIPEIQNLAFQNRFHAKVTRCDQFHIFHPSLISLMIFPSKSLIVNTLSSRTAYVGGFPSFGIDTDPGFRRIYPSLCSALSTCVCPWIRISPS